MHPKCSTPQTPALMPFPSATSMAMERPTSQCRSMSRRTAPCAWWARFFSATSISHQLAPSRQHGTYGKRTSLELTLQVPIVAPMKKVSPMPRPYVVV